MTRGSRPIAILIVLFLILGSAYSVITPMFEASDELWHYPAVKYIADHGFGLPVQDPATTPGTLWRQEGGQPPLYYLLGAALTFWIDTSDLPTVRRINPHADIGIIMPDGNANMVVHDPAVEAFPWHGTVLAVHQIRLLSVLMGAVTVSIAYLLTLELFPARRGVALTAAALVAFNPMFLFISGSVNNDNLSNMLASVLLLQIVRLLKRTEAPPLRDLIAIGTVAGVGMLAKFNIGFLLPLIALSLAIVAWRVRDVRVFLVGALVTGALTVAIAGWWYVRNQRLYGDPTGLNVFLDIVGRRDVPANLAQLWSERTTFVMSYWGFFGGVNVPLPGLAYALFNLIAIVAGIGVIVTLGRFVGRIIGRRPGGSETRPYAAMIFVGAIFTIVWIVVLFMSLLRWTSETWASQGRLMFSAIAPLSMWMAVGLWAIPRVRGAVAWAAVLAFATVAAVVGPIVIASTYTPHAFIGIRSPCSFDPGSAPADLCYGFSEPNQRVESLFLWELQYPPKMVDTGHYLEMNDSFRFIVTQKPTRDWSAVIQLHNEEGLIVAQRDVYLQQGLGATSLMERTEQWINTFAVRIPDHAYAPQQVKVYFGLYDVTNGERMSASIGDPLTQYKGSITPDNLAYLGSVTIYPASNNETVIGVPNSASVNFGDQAEFVGYDISKLVTTPGDKLTVTLYWRAKQPLTTDYRVFVQLLEPRTTHTFGKDDAVPAAWSRPTSTWKPGEIIVDAHTFIVDPTTPPGTWQIAIGMYQLSKDGKGANQFNRLRIITPDGGQAEDMLYLTRVKVDLPPPSKPEDF